MQVQSISTTPRVNNNTFKASFVNDANGYFRQLWKSSNIMKNEEFEKSVQLFSQRHRGHNIEITNVTKDSKSPLFSIYEVFNHRNGQSSAYWEKDNLPDLLVRIIDDKALFDESRKETKMYQKLTGQKINFVSIP